MEIYEFKKCLLDRMEESMNVLSWKDEVITPSKVRSEWSYYIELWMEPGGWQALWRIPRVICEELNLRYPTVVFGMVEQVDYQELKAIFIVEAVQDDDVHLAERHQVSLQDLYPTRNQENTELNVQRTAECLDRMRFFYTSVWMPWDNDNDEDFNWVEKHLESRIRFCYDLHKRIIKRPLAAHIKALLAEAKYIQQRREYIELDMSDDEDLNNTQKSEMSNLMRLHLRLSIIRNELEMLENPEMRRIYEELHFDEHKCVKPQKGSDGKAMKRGPVSYMVTKLDSLRRQLQTLHHVESLMASTDLLHLCSSLEDCLGICAASDRIFLAPGRHSIKFLEYLNDDGSIVGVSAKSQVLQFTTQDDEENMVVVFSQDNDSILLVCDGNFTLEGLTLDCTNVRTGILIKKGCLHLKDCVLIGNKTSSTNVGIQLNGDNTELILNDCVINNFATGITTNGSNTLTIRDSSISNCNIALDLSVHTSSLSFDNAIISDAGKCGIFLDSVPLINRDEKSALLKDIDQLKQYVPSLKTDGTCTFSNCKNNIYVLNELVRMIASHTLRHMFDDCEALDSENA